MDIFDQIASNFTLTVIVVFVLGVFVGSSTTMMFFEFFSARRYKKMEQLFLSNELNWKDEFRRELKQATFDLRVEILNTRKSMGIEVTGDEQPTV